MKPFDVNITDLIPQRPPVVMIDKLLAAGESSARGNLFIDENNLFVRDKHLNEAGLTEFMAQTAAAYKGYQKVSSGEEVNLGYIASIRNLLIHKLPESGTTIECHIRVENEVLGYTIITGQVLFNDDILAEAEMRIKIDQQA